MKFIFAIIFAILSLDLSQQIQDVNYTHYLMQRQWTPTQCLGRHCSAKYMENIKPNSFNMHGLWPTGKPNDIRYQWHDCRSNFTYNQTLIKPDLLKWMSENFVGLFSSTEVFRSHEYTKHGSCYNYPKNENSPVDFHNTYFSKIRDLKNKFNLTQAFNDYQIVPSNSRPYQYQDLVSAIMETYSEDEGAIPQIYCINKGRRQILKGVNMCFDLNFKFITCPVQGRQCSPNKPVFLIPFSNSNDEQDFLA